MLQKTLNQRWQDHPSRRVGEAQLQRISSAFNHSDRLQGPQNQSDINANARSQASDDISGRR
jgi:hypothetical protein